MYLSFCFAILGLLHYNFEILTYRKDIAEEDAQEITFAMPMTPMILNEWYRITQSIFNALRLASILTLKNIYCSIGKAWHLPIYREDEVRYQ